MQVRPILGPFGTEGTVTCADVLKGSRELSPEAAPIFMANGTMRSGQAITSALLNLFGEHEGLPV